MMMNKWADINDCDTNLPSLPWKKKEESVVITFDEFQNRVRDPMITDWECDMFDEATNQYLYYYHLIQVREAVYKSQNEMFEKIGLPVFDSDMKKHTTRFHRECLEMDRSTQVYLHFYHQKKVEEAILNSKAGK